MIAPAPVQARRTGEPGPAERPPAAKGSRWFRTWKDLEGLEETLAVLSDPAALADIREADASYTQGDVMRGVDAVRALRRRRSKTTTSS